MRAPDRGREGPARAFSPKLPGLLLPGLLAAATSAGAQEARSVPDPITATLDVTRTGPPIDPLLYGYFIENLGSIFAVAGANPSESHHTLQLDFRGGTPRGGRVWTLASPELGARAVPGAEPVSMVTEAAITDAGASLTVPAAAIQLYELRLE